MTEDLEAQAKVATERLGVARQALAVADAARRALRAEHQALRRAEGYVGAQLPLWAQQTMTAAARIAQVEYSMAADEVVAASAELTDLVDRRVARLCAGAEGLAAGRVTA